ncbi:anti-sigma factor [Streptomyces sp. NPDC006339]|uniref:anti-sigma factor n=1 Tax=Streptomyces sp. NPDC006339 TaxID=3156755 RepID=UPI0033B2A64C
MRQHHSDLHTLAAAYALHALDPAERTAFSDHLQHCEECHKDVAEFEATAARLAAAAAQAPPASMKQHTMNAVDGVRQAPPRLPLTASATNLAGGMRRRTLHFALAASLTAAASFAGLSAWQYQEREDSLRQARQVQRQLDAVSTVLAAPDARTTHGRTTNGALTAVVTSGRQDKAVFTAIGLPAPARGTTYQLWLEYQGTMRPAGVLHTDGTVLLVGSPTGATAIGLTLEPSAGSAQPTTAPLLLMDLPV